MQYRDFLEAGYKVFPLYGADRNGHCECGDIECEAVYKHPRMPNWQNTPDWCPEQLANMEGAGWFDTGYGVFCRGLLVIDVDARNGGVESFAKFANRYPDVNEDTLEVSTGSGGGSKHVYFQLDEPLSLVQSLPEYPGLDFKSTGYVCGPGSMHKSGARYLADGYVSEIAPAPVSIIDALKRPEYHRATFNGAHVDVSHADIADMLVYFPNHDLDYETWVKIGMAIHHSTQGTGYELWSHWSSTSAKHNEKKMQAKWHSFGKSANPTTIATIIHFAEAGGWLRPVEFVSEVEFTEEPADGAYPFSIDGIDLTQPPGFTGEIAKWIESNSIRPRRHLAAAGALMAVANIGGLRYTDDRRMTTTNMFCFCVAGSGTGKENIFSCLLDIMMVAGMGGAFYGDIKSSKEIVENFVHHQAAIYSIDEVGDSMDKWDSSTSKTAPAYLTTVMSTLMETYSKAKKMLVLKGDRKRELQSALLKELTSLEKAIGENDASPFQKAKLPSLKRMLSASEIGIEKPFVSVVGFTTPVKFDRLVTFDNTTSGFIGRSLIFNERDTAPAMKAGYMPVDMPETMANTIRLISCDGDYDMFANRVEYYEERKPIPTTADALEMLEKARVWYDVQALDHKAQTGLESLWMRALELLSKVSLTLAIPEGLRTAEHVRWGFALIRRDIEEKMRLVIGNEDEKRDPQKALRARVLNICADEGETEGVVVNKLSRTYRKEDVLAQLAGMVEIGLLSLTEAPHARSKKIVRSYTSAA